MKYVYFHKLSRVFKVEGGRFGSVKISRKSSNEAQLDRLMIDTKKSLYRMQKGKSSSTPKADYTFQATLINPLHAKLQT